MSIEQKANIYIYIYIIMGICENFDSHVTKQAKFKVYVSVETKKIEVYQNYMTNDIATYHLLETVRDLK